MLMTPMRFALRSSAALIALTLLRPDAQHAAQHTASSDTRPLPSPGPDCSHYPASSHFVYTPLHANLNAVNRH